MFYIESVFFLILGEDKLLLCLLTGDSKTTTTPQPPPPQSIVFTGLTILINIKFHNNHLYKLKYTIILKKPSCISCFISGIYTCKCTSHVLVIVNHDLKILNFSLLTSCRYRIIHMQNELYPDKIIYKTCLH